MASRLGRRIAAVSQTPGARPGNAQQRPRCLSLVQPGAEAARGIKTLITASVERVEQGLALVEQSAAAADSLKQQARQPVAAVAALRLEPAPP